MGSSELYSRYGNNIKCFFLTNFHSRYRCIHSSHFRRKLSCFFSIRVKSGSGRESIRNTIRSFFCYSVGAVDFHSSKISIMQPLHLEFLRLNISPEFKMFKVPFVHKSPFLDQIFFGQVLIPGH